MQCVLLDMEILNMCIVPKFKKKKKKFFLETFQQNVIFLVYISTDESNWQPNSEVTHAYQRET
jgi:hypothetical protein